MKPAISALRTAVYKSGLAAVFPFRPAGFLRESGWFRSLRSLAPQSADGSPRPWLTEPAVDFLGPLLNKSQTVGEYGSGNSTLWLAERVGSVVSVEHSPEWVAKFRKTAPSNVDLRMPAGAGSVELPQDAFRAPAAFPTYCKTLDDVERIELVLVDGLDRVGCIQAAQAKHIGVIVVDNTDDRYELELRAGLDALASDGYRRFDFHGVALGSWHKSCTSVFLASENCFAL